MENFAVIIEDDEDLAEIFGQALTAAGYTVELIADGAIAQARLKELTPTVIILDMHLPHISGDVLLKQIRADSRLEKTNVVVTTADALMGDAMRDIADFVFIKPITFTQLKDLTIRLRKSE